MDNIASWIWVLIPVTAIIAGTCKSWLRSRERQMDIASQQVVEKAAQYAAKTERLEQRVAVLERILTDRSAHLADEIERLRDQPLN